MNRLHHTPRAMRMAFYALLLLLPLLAAFPLWGPGMVNTRGGGDSPFLLQRTLDVAASLQHGIFPPRWMAHAAYDLGYPFFNHYAALPYYLSGALTALGFSPILAIQATQTLGFLLAALAMGLWARRVYHSRVAVLLAVAAYTCAPFHLVNVYVRGDSLSEFYAFVWYPLILWTLDRAAERATLRRITLAALSYAALILTHNVSALIFAPFALLYAVIRNARESLDQPEGGRLSRLSRVTRLAFHIVAPFVLAFLLTAWFWLPAIGETVYGQMGPEFTAGYFHYSNHFRGSNLVQYSFFFNYAVAGEASAAGPFAMGLVQTLLALLGAVCCALHIVRHNTTQRTARTMHYGFILFGLVLSTVMITRLSEPLWKHLPLLATTQFPWRFLSVQALFTAIVTGAIVCDDSAEKRERDGVRVLSRFAHYASRILPVFLIVLAALFTLRPERLLITASDVTWDNLLLYETFTGNIGTTIRYEYLPNAVRPRLYISEAVVDGVNAAQPIADSDVALAAELLERTPVHQSWQLALEDDAPVVFPLHWWPGWEAEVDGITVAAYPMTGSGRLAVNVAAGEHAVTLRLRNTPLRSAAAWISVLTVLILGVWLYLGGRQMPRDQRLKSGLYLLVIVLGLSLLLPFVFAGFPGPALSPSSRRLNAFDFIQAPYPHHEPVQFGPLLLEEAYATSGDSSDALHIVAAPGESIGLGFRWRQMDTTPLTGTLRLVSPAEPRHGVSYSLAETTFAMSSFTDDGVGAAGYSVTLPPDLTRGLYLLELHIYGPEGELSPQTPQGMGRGTLCIGAVQVRENPARSLDAPIAAQLGELTLHSATALQASQDTLRLRLSWSLARRIPRNWSLSLRLLDAEGRQLSQLDLQPGYGYLPTTLWQPGEWITDYPVLSVPEGLAPGDYTLRIIAYLEATMEPGAEADVPLQLTEATLQDPRAACCEWERRDAQMLCAAEGVGLTGLILPESHPEGVPLDFVAEWSVVEQTTVELMARWEAVDTLGNAVAMREGPLAPGSRASAWPSFAWVRAPVTLALPPLLPDGPYILRLTLLDGDTTLRICELGTLDIVPRPRSFDLPAPAFPQQANFGTELRLLGYDVTENDNALTLTLWWQAQTTPSRDYKRFVHILASDNAIIAQDDAMPRAWTYPTSWWAAGEVVSETITLAVPAGQYRVGVGWYAGDSGVTLPATDAAGVLWADNRVLLDQVISPE